MKKTGKNRMRFSLTLTALSGIIIVCSVLFFYYIRHFSSALQEENYYRLSEVSGYIVDFMEKMLEDKQVELELLASFAADIKDRDEQAGYLCDMAKELGYEYIGIAGEDGMLKASAFPEPVDISDEAYFKAALKGEACISDLTRVIFYDRAVGGVIMAVPARGENGGVMAAMISTAKLGENVQVDSFNKEGYSYIINKKGNLVLHARSLEYNNLFQYLGNLEFASGYSARQLEQDIAAGRKGMAVYYDFGIEKYAYYRPMDINGWTVVSTVPAGVLTRRTAALSGNLIELCVAVMVVFIILFTVVCTLFLGMESRRRENEARSAFFANMSHDMRTPMNAIMGMTAIAGAHAGEPDTVRDCLKKIEQSGSHLLGLINDLLEMAKIESGKAVLASRAFLLPTMLGGVINIIYPLVRQKKQHFSVRIRHICHERLLGDELRLSQIFINILTNAVKFTPEEGEIAVTVEELPETDGERAVFLFSFSDNGIGMKPEFINHMFEPFTREHDSRVDKIQGSGLGMTITRRFVDLMQGKLEVESEEGRGTVFQVELAFPVCEEEETKAKAGALYSSVLLAGGSEEQGTESTALLAGLGVKAAWAEDAKSAAAHLENAREDGYQAVLIDRELYDNGELDELLEACGKNTVKLLAAYDWDDIRTDAIQKGIMEFVPKPLFQSVLKEYLCPGAQSVCMTEFMEPESFDFAGRSILLAEDNEMNLEIIRSILEETGADITCTVNGEECLNRFMDSPEDSFDLILMDIRMPVMNGYEASRRIRASVRRDSDVPIFAMSANAYPEDKEEAERCGMNGYLTKPIDLAVWLEEISRCLNSH